MRYKEGDILSFTGDYLTIISVDLANQAYIIKWNSDDYVSDYYIETVDTHSNIRKLTKLERALK